MLNRTKTVRTFGLLLCLVSALQLGCHAAAAPMALKMAKYRRVKMLHRAYRTKAVTALEKQYDVNGNGVIDPVEATALRQRLMYEKSVRDYRKMDLNGDGLVDVEEYEWAHPQ